MQHNLSIIYRSQSISPEYLEGIESNLNCQYCCQFESQQFPASSPEYLHLPNPKLKLVLKIWGKEGF